MEFHNKTVIITGASVGIGKATAIEFARNGANVSSYICDVSDEQRVHETTQEIINQALLYGKMRRIRSICILDLFFSQ